MRKSNEHVAAPKQLTEQQLKAQEEYCRKIKEAWGRYIKMY